MLHLFVVMLQEAVANSRGAQQALVPGRVVITLNTRSGLPELGVVCGQPPTAAAAATTGESVHQQQDVTLVTTFVTLNCGQNPSSVLATATAKAKHSQRVA